MYCVVSWKHICVYNSGGVSESQGSVLLENQIKIIYLINDSDIHSNHECALIIINNI